MHQSPDRTRRARRLRADTTPAESSLWTLLRNRGFEGWKFRRQAPVAGYVTDFLCLDLKLVIELDGRRSSPARGRRRPPRSSSV
ncbi:endonuclease domain-containing protein [Brevundimonas sp. 2YAF1]|uniref:endonuclease domain-containing protein n=1 Tax=Brevundimonas sp. 2YAF1 TaxID=3233024 RepID=UPI003F8E8646